MNTKAVHSPIFPPDQVFSTLNSFELSSIYCLLNTALNGTDGAKASSTDW